jgi:hypothetical protein
MELMVANPADKSEEQIAKEREAVEAMRNAKANMSAALDRIATLESALKLTIANLSQARTYISPSVYIYPIPGSNVTVHTQIDQWIAAAQAKLGVSA